MLGIGDPASTHVLKQHLKAKKASALTWATDTRTPGRSDGAVSTVRGRPRFPYRSYEDKPQGATEAFKR